MINLGDKVRDKVSGLIGTVTSRIEYLNGCIQYGIQPKVKKDATEIITWNIDENQLEKIGKTVKVKKPKTNGGPTRKVTSYYL